MKRGTSLYRLLPLATSAFCVVALAGTASAATAQRTASSRIAQATTTTATPSALAGYFSSAGTTTTSYNSSGGSVLWSSSGVGLNQIVFTGLSGITGGNVEVSSETSDHTCSVFDWLPDAGNLDVNVYCYTYGGALDNADFSLLVTQPFAAPHGAVAYDWIAHPAKSYTLTGRYQYNSTGQKNHVVHLGAGRYKVVMPGVGTTGTHGTVKVSAYGAGGGDCQLGSWYAVDTVEVIGVRCFSAAGALHNRQFVITYTRSSNLMGQKGMTSANALANRPTATAYLPHVQYDGVSGAKVDIYEYGAKHVFEVVFAGSRGHYGNANGGGGNVQITAQGANDTHCYILNWVQTFPPMAEVACLDNGGNLVSSKYTIQWVTR